MEICFCSWIHCMQSAQHLMIVWENVLWTKRREKLQLYAFASLTVFYVVKNLLVIMQSSGKYCPIDEAVPICWQAVQSAAQATATMEARAGRASYVSAQHHTQPDAGAQAVAVWVKAVCNVIVAAHTK